MAEETIVPSFLRPDIRLAPVFNSPPVGQAYHLVTVHAEEGSRQLVGRSLTLIKYHVGGFFQVFLIVFPAVVETGHLGVLSQFRRHDILLYAVFGTMLHNAAGTGGIHSHCRFARRVQSLHQCVHDVIGRNAPVAGGESAALLLELQFIAQAPHDDRGVIAVALHPFHQVLPPHLRPRAATRPCQRVRPLVVQFVDNEDAFLVGQTQESLAIGVVAGADMVEAKRLDLIHHTGNTRLIGGSAHCAYVMVVGHALQEDFLAVQFEAKLLREFHLTDAETLCQLVDGFPVENKAHFGRVQIRCLTPPQLRLGYRHLRQLNLHGGLLVVFGGCDVCLTHLLTVRTVYLRLDGQVQLLVLDTFHFHLHGDRSPFRAHLRRMDIDAMAGYGYRVFQHHMDIAEQTATRIPARVLRFSRRAVYGQHVLRVIPQQSGDVGLKAQVTVVCATNLLTVQIGIAMQHDTLEVQDDALALPCLIGIKRLTIPARSHVLEATTAVCLLVPRHLYLEIVWQVKTPPTAVVEVHPRGIGRFTQFEFPVEIKQHALPFTCYRHRGGHEQTRQGHQ